MTSESIFKTVMGVYVALGSIGLLMCIVFFGALWFDNFYIGYEAKDDKELEEIFRSY